MVFLCAKRRIERRIIDDEHVDLCLHRGNELAIVDGLRKRISLAWHPWQLLAALHFFQLPILLGFSSLRGRLDRCLVVVFSPRLKLVGSEHHGEYHVSGGGEAIASRSDGTLSGSHTIGCGDCSTLWVWFKPLGLVGHCHPHACTVWLHPHDPRYGLLTPLLRLKEESGSGLMVVVALAWGFTAILDQSAVQHIPPALHALILAAGMFIAGVLGFYRANRKQKDIYPSVVSPWVLGTGAMMAIAMVAQFEAFMRIDVAVVEAVKRIIGTTSAVVLGVVFYGEKEFTRRLIASALMGVGAAILVLSL